MTGSEQRRARRERTLLQGRIIFAGGLRSAPCRIRDLSEDGAKLSLARGTPLPDTFTIEVPSRDISHQARVVRGHDEGPQTTYGITFEKGPVLASEDKIKALEAEVIRLKLRVAALVDKLTLYGITERDD